MVEREEEEGEGEEEATPQKAGGKRSNGKDIDLSELSSKLKGIEKDRSYQSKITVNLGCEEYDKGKNKITQDIFEGRDKTQNAELFIENL